MIHLYDRDKQCFPQCQRQIRIVPKFLSAPVVHSRNFWEWEESFKFGKNYEEFAEKTRF